MSWYTYIVECNDRSLYTGITTDTERRVHEHNHTKRGAKYTRARRPVSLVWCSMPMRHRSLAMETERNIRSMSKAKKEAMLPDTQS